MLVVMVLYELNDLLWKLSKGAIEGSIGLNIHSGLDL